MRRLVAALARRDDGADALRAVDLDQLQIENEQLLARMEQRNGDLLALKLTTGRSVQACLPTTTCSGVRLGWPPNYACCYGVLADVCSTRNPFPIRSLVMSGGRTMDACTCGRRWQARSEHVL